MSMVAFLLCCTALPAPAAVSASRHPCNPCEEISGCCGGRCCGDELQPHLDDGFNTVLKNSDRANVAVRGDKVTDRTSVSRPPHPDNTQRLPSVTAMANWTTVFRVGEKGFGCMRFPELHHANNTLYMFVECCELIQSCSNCMGVCKIARFHTHRCRGFVSGADGTSDEFA